MLLRPGMTVLARSLSMRREIQAVFEGRNGCRPEQWLARRVEPRILAWLSMKCSRM